MHSYSSSRLWSDEITNIFFILLYYGDEIYCLTEQYNGNKQTMHSTS